ncbi:MAG: hypothetical protein JWO82_22, partial [Akkermansiaceae bacterium]|nr:hypothetical protein [Akkermansiaceae bacterium]
KVALKAAALDEASGMVVSQRDDQLLWLLNDSGGAPALYLAGTDGSDRGLCVIRGATNVDWEDLSSFKLDGKPYLLIADAGDNASKRQSCTLYIIAEPPLPKPGAALNAVAPIAWSIHFVYPDGPRDCEAVAVDAAAQKIILVSKRTKPPVVYELPLHPADPAILQVAKRVGTTSVPQPEWSIPIPYGTQPTGLAFSPDGATAAIVTYTAIHIFPRAKGESWAAALGRPATQILPHPLSQAESIAFSSNGKTLRIVSEGLHSPILTYQR